MDSSGKPCDDESLLVNILGVRHMPKWVKSVEYHEIVDDVAYFLALRPVTEMGQWMFYSELKNGKRQFSLKPGLAIKFIGSEKLRCTLKDRPELCAVEVPPNADRKWRSRR
jgi:hypothetical protein